MADRGGRTFSELSRASGAGSLAYWLGLFWQAKAGPGAPTAVEVASAMAHQLEQEEQAARTGRLFPDTGWTRYLAPLAPVQVTEAWSPLPDAVLRLGEPALELRESDPDGGRDAAVLCWSEAAVRGAARGVRVPAFERDRSRLHGLLNVAIERARERGAGLLLCARPGWSHGQGLTFDPRTRALMQAAGFAVTDRRAGAPSRGPGG